MRVAPIDHRWWHNRRLSTYDLESVGLTQVDWSTEPHGSGWVVRYSIHWTYNWGGLTTSLSIFLFLILFLFIRLNVSVYMLMIYISVYMLMIYKLHKSRVWFAFLLNINETQPWKFIGKNRNPFFRNSALFFFSFLGLAVCELDL